MSKWDQSGLKEACQRALKLGRTRQDTDIRLCLDALLEIERLELEVAELTHIFELQRKREEPWIERWREETGKELSLPDYGAMLQWIIDKADTAEAELQALKRAYAEHGIAGQ